MITAKGTEGTEGGGGQRRAAEDPLAPLALRALCPLCALLLSCTDPRERIVPPEVRLSFAPGTTVTSPDTLVGSAYAFDADGLEFFFWTLWSSDGSLRLDSTEAIAGTTEFSRQLTFQIPAGLPSGTVLHVLARASDAAGYRGRDSTAFTIP